MLMNVDYAFMTSDAMTITSVVTPSDCAGTLATGTAEIEVIGGVAPYYVEMGAQNDYDVDVFFFDELLDGVQQVNVYDGAGCQATFFVDIPSANSLMNNEIIHYSSPLIRNACRPVQVPKVPGHGGPGAPAAPGLASSAPGPWPLAWSRIHLATPWSGPPATWTGLYAFRIKGEE